jgi:hypothetical protein
VPVTPWRLRRDAVEVGVTAVGGMLDPVRFRTERGSVEPMHRAPWVDDPPPAVPMLQHLRGDFCCAPFGASDLLDGEPRPHGTPANGSWQLLHQDEHELRLELGGRVMGARVLETIRLVPGHPVVDQRHELVGGSGRLPLGHHAMLHASERLRLSFAPYRWGATPPAPRRVRRERRALAARLPAGVRAARAPTRVTRVETRPGSLEIADGARSVVVPFDVSFVTGAGGGAA